LTAHILEASKYARKKELNSRDIATTFPVPRASEVDSDEWIDFDSMDDLENKMNEIIGVSMHKDAKDDEEKHMLGMNEMLNGLQKFVSGKSDIEGVSSDINIAAPGRRKGHDDESIHINGDIYLEILHRTLKNDANDLRFDDISGSAGNQMSTDDSSDLLKYFSREDLDSDEDSVDETGSSENEFNDRETDMSMKELMVSNLV